MSDFHGSSPGIWLAILAIAVHAGCAAPRPASSLAVPASAMQSPEADVGTSPPATGDVRLAAGLEPVALTGTTLTVAAAAAADSEAGSAVQPAGGGLAVVAATNAAPNAAAIDFGSALAIAAGDNPQVAFARERINEAFAQTCAADALWVPSLRAGMNYNKHEGAIQDVAGNIIDTSRGSFYSGFGAQAVGAGSPAVPGLVMSFHTKDLLHQPRIARHVLAANRHASQATTNDVLLETALAYNELLEAHAVAAVAANTQTNAERLARTTADYARSGQGLPSDAERAQAELAARQIESQRADEAIRVASARLARLLSQSPTIQLVPTEKAVTPIELAPASCELADLIATGLSHRPELSESKSLTASAVERLRRERHAPLVPSVLLGLSYGANGGGLGGDLINFGDRMDFDAIAFWEVRNLGYGEQAARSEARSRVEQARWRQVQVMDQVASEIAEAYFQVESRRGQIETARSGITAARDSYRRNSDRIHDGVGLPIEVLQSLQALDAAQRQYVRTIADYNRAQFRLQRAIGWPIQEQ